MISPLVVKNVKLKGELVVVTKYITEWTLSANGRRKRWTEKTNIEKEG